MEALTLEWTVFTVVVSLQREKKTKKSRNVSCKNQEVDKAVHPAIFDKKDDEWSIELKGRYACVKMQCTIYSVVQIFGLVKVIQRKVLCSENVEKIQLYTKKECFSKSLNILILTQINSLILQFWKK